MAKAKLNVDPKEFLLKYGERIGLGVAGGITLLLLFLSLFRSERGFFSGSPATKAKELDEITQRVNFALNDPNNKPTRPEDLPPPNADEKIKELDRSSINASEHVIAALVTSETGGSLGRRVPKVFAIEEAVAKYKPMRIQSYIFDDRGQIYALKGGSGSSSGLGGLLGGGGRGGGMPGLGGGMPGLGGGMPGLGGGSPDTGGASGLGVPGQLAGLEGEKKDRPVVLIPLNQLEKRIAGHTLAEQVRPVRMAIIAGAFPFKRQVEEFRDKLGLRSTDEVLSEMSVETGPDRVARPSFRFLGVRAQRRELDGNGLPRKELGPDGKPLGEWRDLNLNASYNPYRMLTGKREEPEDPEFTAVIYDGLVMPRLMQFREGNLGTGATSGSGTGMMAGGGRGGFSGTPPGGDDTGSADTGGARGAMPAPGLGGGGAMAGRRPSTDPDDEYPKPEKELKLIQKTLDDIKGKNVAVVAAPPDQFRTDDDDVFSTRSSASSSTTPMGGVGGAMAGMVGPRPGGNRGTGGPPGLGGSMSPPGTPGVPGTPGTPGIPGMGMNDPSQPAELPEYCLVRLIDVTVEPGKTYEYRLQVRMANPNKDRRDVASPAYSTDKELVSPWTDPEKVSIRVQVDPEMHFYAVDQAVYEEKENNNRRYRGPYQHMALMPNQQIWLQAHRWLETVRIRGNQTLLFGEWTMAERFPAWKGEYIGSTERVEVPVWQFARESFTIASDVNTTGRKPGIPLYFGFDPEGNTPREALLVDFTPSRIGYRRAVSHSEDEPAEPKLVDDVSSPQALILRPDGRLMLLEGGRDYNDPERVERVKKIRQRIEDTKKPHKSAETGTGIGGPGAGGR